MKGNLIYGQSGGPTAVINSTAAGVFLEALKHEDKIEKVYAAGHGIVGILEEEIYDIGKEDEEDLLLLKQTPSSALGSCRYKLADVEEEDEDYFRILDVFRKYNIRYFLYNGGNDSMDTCSKISKFLAEHDYPCQVIGVPKTIDNDLCGTDHCPGYGSAARYIAVTMREIYKDSVVYDRPQVTVVEIMGRHAGWLTAASALASYKGAGPDLIYLPEVTFDLKRALADIKNVFERKGKVLICLSEGVQTAEGKFLHELTSDNISTDAFGHKQLGGAAASFGALIKDQMPAKVRSIELSLMQRAAAHLASKLDLEESFFAGQEAVRAALAGKSDIMIGFSRPETGEYKTQIINVPLSEAANDEKTIPLSWIQNDGNGVKQEFLDYAFPLIQGAPQILLDEDAMPRYAELKFHKIQ